MVQIYNTSINFVTKTPHEVEEAGRWKKARGTWKRNEGMFGPSRKWKKRTSTMDDREFYLVVSLTTRDEIQGMLEYENRNFTPNHIHLRQCAARLLPWFRHLMFDFDVRTTSAVGDRTRFAPPAKIARYFVAWELMITEFSLRLLCSRIKHRSQSKSDSSVPTLIAHYFLQPRGTRPSLWNCIKRVKHPRKRLVNAGESAHNL